MKNPATMGGVSVSTALISLLAHVEHQIVIDQLVAVASDDLLLQLFDLRIEELDDITAINADHMVVMATVGQLEYGMPPSKLWRTTRPAASN